MLNSLFDAHQSPHSELRFRFLNCWLNMGFRSGRYTISSFEFSILWRLTRRWTVSRYGRSSFCQCCTRCYSISRDSRWRRPLDRRRSLESSRCFQFRLDITNFSGFSLQSKIRLILWFSYLTKFSGFLFSEFWPFWCWCFWNFWLLYRGIMRWCDFRLWQIFNLFLNLFFNSLIHLNSKTIP